jgi:hypothetical protein
VTTRSFAILVGLCAVAAFVLAFGVQRLTSGGAPIATTAQSSQAESAGPTASPPAVGLPRADLTPGAINPDATQGNLQATVCEPGWATSVRPPSAYTSALKIVQIVQYGYADKDPGHYQEDHLVPLQLGGAPRDRRNLWPEPNTISLTDGTSIGSKEKDDLEDTLHNKVCKGSMRLADAQLVIASDWIAAWEAEGRP